MVTKIRFIVEVRNGHIKSKWKYFNGEKNVESIPYLMKDYEVCAALLNAFSPTILSDKNDFDLIGPIMLSQMNEKNLLSVFVTRIPRTTAYTTINNLSLEPKLSLDDLKSITQGTYQISQAKSYCQMHLKANDNRFKTNLLSAEQCRQFFSSLITNHRQDPRLILVKLPSRFVSQKCHKTYVLVDLNGNGREKIIAYCCSCKNGLRTVG